MSETDPFAPSKPSWRETWRTRLFSPFRYATRGTLRIGLGVLVVLLLLYYPLGALLVHRIDDNPDFTITDIGRGESRAVAITAALIAREVDSHWVANDPFFYPTALLDNMPNYQQGIIDALARFAVEMNDQIGRIRGSSKVDEDLQTASGRLKYPGTEWLWDPKVSLLPTASSEAQYRNARLALLSYNRRLGKGDAVFDRRADNLLGLIERITSDIGSDSGVIDAQVAAHAGDMLDFSADEVFYRIKGKLYAYYLILREIGQDFAPVISERQAQGAWDQMVSSLRTAATLHPSIIINGAPDAQVEPSHLIALGFYLLRARTQMEEIANILLK